MTHVELRQYVAGESAHVIGMIREAERLARAERMERNRRRDSRGRK